MSASAIACSGSCPPRVDAGALAAPVRTGTLYQVRGEVLTRAGDRVRARAELLDPDGAIVAAADATFLLASDYAHDHV